MFASRRCSEDIVGGAAGGDGAAGSDGAAGGWICQSGPVIEKVDAVLILGCCEVGPVCIDCGISATYTREFGSNVIDKTVYVGLSIL